MLAAWSVDPLVVAPVFWLAVGYAWLLRRARDRGRAGPGRWRVTAFYVGLLAIIVALVGPPGVWNDRVFFLHMIQHLLLMIVAAPLLLIGRPAQLLIQAARPAQVGKVLRPALRRRWPRTALNAATHPAFVLVVYNANLAIWHLPGAYGLALESRIVHELEHLAFFSTALHFWWIIIDPVPRHHRVGSHWLLGLSFVTCMVGNLIAAALTLSPRLLYPHYADTTMPWGLSPLSDQHIGGGIMWISGAVYFAIMFGALYRMVQPRPSAAPRESPHVHHEQPAHVTES